MLFGDSLQLLISITCFTLYVLALVLSTPYVQLSHLLAPYSFSFYIIMSMTLLQLDNEMRGWLFECDWMSFSL